MANKFVVFDFCETLISFQTADRFVDFIIKNENYQKHKGLRILNSLMTKFRLIAVIRKLFPQLNFSKRLKLLQIRGISVDILENYAIRFYEEVLMKNKIDVLYNLLRSHKENGDHILIVSGGYGPYIKYFAQVHGINFYFATEIACVNNKVTGKFLNKDCLFGQKVVLIDSYLKRNSLKFDESIVYSDSITDLPLLQWADNAYVVSRDQSQKWVKEYGFNEIVWNP